MRRHSFSTIAACTALLFLSSLFAQTGLAQNRENAERESIYIDACVALSLSDVEVPALESGLLLDVPVKEGDAVQAGQLVAQLDDRIARRLLEEAEKKLESAKARAADESEILAATARYRLTTEEYTKTLELAQRGSKSDFELQRAKYSMEASKYELERARTAKKIALLDQQTEEVRVAAARDSVERHKITTKIDGLVAERFHEAGEWVMAGEKVARVIRVDRLKVQGHLDGTEVDPFEVAGKPVTVTLEMARGRRVDFQGTITFVGIEKRGSNRYSVWAEVDNRKENGYWMLQAGSEVEMRIHLDRPTTNNGESSFSPE